MWFLKFRKRSQHKECSFCHDMRENLLKPGQGTAQKMQWAWEWQEHLRAQYHDRLIYWSLRWASRAKMNVLTIIIDGMDKVKTAWPQYHSHRKPAYLESCHRPRVVLSAVLCHGWCTNIYLTPEGVHHGGGHFCELLFRALDSVAEIARREKREFPQHLVIQSDNTTAQAKNSLVSNCLAYLVARGKFLTATLNFLTVGHTHEDVDRLFSLILVACLRRYRFEVPEDLRKSLVSCLQEHVHAKQEQLNVNMVMSIRDFDGWLKPLLITQHNCFVTRRGRLAAHSFIYKVRSDLSPAQVSDLSKLGRRVQRGFPEHPEDVFAITKGRMYHTKTMSPVLVLPHAILNRISGSVPKDILKQEAMTKPERDNLEKLARTLRCMPQPYLRAARDIDIMLSEAEPEQPPVFNWLALPPPPRAAVSITRNAYYEHLPDTSWNLVATFHRS